MSVLSTSHVRDHDDDPVLPANSENGSSEGLSGDLEACPRCGEVIREILWGHTNCPRCSLHFECC